MKIKIPPKSYEAEQALLGCILIRPDCYYEVEAIQADFFYEDKHRIIWHFMVEMLLGGEDVDILTLTQKLKDNEMLDRVGGASYLAELMSLVPTASHVKQYASTVRKTFVMRKLISASEFINNLSFEGSSESVDSIIEASEAKMLEATSLFIESRTQDPKAEVLNYQGDDRIISSAELAEELAKTDESVYKLTTGFPSLDRLLDGVEPGELITITGPSGEGKTTLLMSITNHIAKQGNDTVWFTLEVTPRQFVNKIVKGNGGDVKKMPDFYIPRSNFDDMSLAAVAEFKKRHRRDPQMIDWVELRVLEAKLKAEAKGGQLKAVFIDHIHMIFSVSRVERNISLEIGDMVAKIKKMAIDYNLPVFLIAHSKDDPNGNLRDLRQEDIRDSGLIIRLSDTIIGVWRVPNDDDGTSSRRKEVKEDDNKSKIKVLKNRRAGVKGFLMAYHHNHFLTEEAFVGTGFSEFNNDLTK